METEEKVKESERLYTKEEVQAMLKQVRLDEAAPKVDEAEKTTVRLTRFHNKFVVGFKDQNTDPYSEKIVYAFNKFDERERKWVPWIEVVFEDGTTEVVLLQSFVQQSTGVKAELIKTIKRDTSYSLGKVEQRVVEGTKMKGTGVFVDQKVVREERDFVLKLPDGKELTVPDYVVNIGE